MKQIFDVTFRCEAKMLSTVIAVMGNTSGVTLQSVNLLSSINGVDSQRDSTISDTQTARKRNTAWAARAAPVVIAALREMLKSVDPHGPGVHYKDLGKYIMANGGAPGIHKEATITTMLSALRRANKVVKTQRGYYRVP